MTLAMLAPASAALPSPNAAPGTDRLEAALQVPFEENHGQFDPGVAFMAQTFAGKVLVTQDGQLLYRLPHTEAPGTRGLQLRWVNARPLNPIGEQPGPTAITRLTPRGYFHSGTWSSVSLGEPWPGVQVELMARDNNVEQLFHLAPGADPAHIRMELTGALGLHRADDGTLSVATAGGAVNYSAPVAWQAIGGERRPVEVHYALAPDHPDQYGFALGNYDPRYPLIIDPIISSAYIGGTEGAAIHAVAVADDGDIIVAGTSSSTDLPATSSAAQPEHGGNSSPTDSPQHFLNAHDGFIARLSPDMTTLRQLTYLGADARDEIYALALAANGDVLVGGYTWSGHFPGTAGGAQDGSPPGGGPYGPGEFPERSVNDGFITRLSPNLRSIVQSTYLYGDGTDKVQAIAVAPDGDVIVAGGTDSSDLPKREGGARSSYSEGITDGGWEDGFITRLNSGLTEIRQSTYLGGHNFDTVNALVVDADGSIVVSGWTASADFPVTTGAWQTTLGGNHDEFAVIPDGFITRLAPDLKSILASTYLGGPGSDGVLATAIDGDGNIYATGYNGSGSDMPLPTAGGAADCLDDSDDGFAARLSPDLQQVVHATCLAGWTGYAVTMLGDGNLVIAGGAYDAPELPHALNAPADMHQGAVFRLSPDLGTWHDSLYVNASLDGRMPEFGAGTAIMAQADSMAVVMVGAIGNVDDEDSDAPRYGVRNGGDGFITRIQLDPLAEGYVVGGTSIGLETGSATLLLNGAHPLNIHGDGGFSFAARLDDSDDYEVTLQQQPTGGWGFCRIVNGTGTISGADVNRVVLNCVPGPNPPITVGGINFNGPTATDSGLASVQISGGGDACKFDSGGFGPQPPASPPPGLSFPHGFLQFVATDCPASEGAVTITVVYPDLIPADSQYYKWGREQPGDPNHYYAIPATISGNTVTFQVIDGGLGDNDLAINGVIADPGGIAVHAAPPGAEEVAPIPTISHYALALLAALLLLGTAWNRQQRRRKR